MTCHGYGCPNPVGLHDTFCLTCTHTIWEQLATIPPNSDPYTECSCGYQRYGLGACPACDRRTRQLANITTKPYDDALDWLSE